MVRNGRMVIALTALALMSAGCSLFRRTPPTVVVPAAAEQPAPPVQVVVVAGSRLNPDEAGQSLPTVVRLYLLKRTTRLEGADYDAMYRNPKEALGDDLIAAEEMTLSAGEKATRQFERDRGARVVAAIALVRRPSNTSWRAYSELPPAGAGASTFTIDGYRVESH